MLLNVVLQSMEDSLQLRRVQFVIDGHVDDHGQQFEGLLGKTQYESDKVNNGRTGYLI